MAIMPQMYVAVVGAASAPIQAYVAVVDASGNVISGSYGPPGGRLTLTTLVPVLTATVSASATVLYTPYQTDEVPIYNGTSWVMTQFTELTNTLSDATKNPAAAVANANYDLYVWNDGGTMRLSRGPLWSKTSTVTMTSANPGVVSWTSHGLLAGTPVIFTTTGALPTNIVAGTTYYVIAAGLSANAFEVSATVGGSAINTTAGTQSGVQTAVAGADGALTNTTDRVMQNGLLLNNLAITNGPAASRGTYVGTIRTNGTATTDMNFGATGSAALLNIWNAYNRVDLSALVQDSTASWNYTTATVRQANASAVNQVSFIRGLNEDTISTYYNQIMTLVAALGAIAINAVGLDSITTRATGSNTGKFENPAALTTQSGSVTATWQGIPGLGFHYISALELGDGTNANGFSGGINHGLNVKLRA